MFRAFLLLVTASLALYLAGGPTGLLDVGNPIGSLVSNNRTVTTGGVLIRPAVIVQSAPTRLSFGESGVVEVQAEAPATPGATIVLKTAGTYGLGYNRVSRSVLDENLRATLAVPGRKYQGSFNYWASIPATAKYLEGNSASFMIKIQAVDPPAAPICGGPDPVKADGSSWVCSYDDEFNGTELDRRFWFPQETASSGFTTGSKGMYACAEDTPDTIGVHDGKLELSLIELPSVRSCGHGKYSKYAFGHVMHFQTFAQTYGKYEVRAKIPDLTVPGVQQSFWLWPVKNKYGHWPASGEIDFAEMYSSHPGVLRPYIHYLPGQTAAGTNKNITTKSCSINVGEYNTYGVEWKPGQLTIMLNGEVCFTNDYSSAVALLQGKYSPFDQPFYLALTQAMGTTGNLYDPAVVPDRVTTEIDYVRIWK